MNAQSLDQCKWYHVDAGGVVVVLLLSFGTYLLGIKPVLDHRAEQQRQRHRLTQKTQQSAKLTATLGKLQRQLDRMQAAVEASTIRLLPVEKLNQRVAAVTALAGQYRLKVDEVQPGNVTHHEYYDAVPIQLIGQGAYHDCAAFVDALHHRFTDTALAAFELVGRPERADAPATFRFALHWHAAPKPAPHKQDEKP